VSLFCVQVLGLTLTRGVRQPQLFINLKKPKEEYNYGKYLPSFTLGFFLILFFQFILITPRFLPVDSLRPFKHPC
jgi:hypothetical protein